MSTELDFPRWPDDFARKYREKGYWQGESIGGMLRRLARTFPDRIAVSCRGCHCSYAELSERADQLADGMAILGLRPGDRVVVQLPNSIEFVEVLFGLFRLGAIPVLALPSDRVSEIRHVLVASSARAYVIRDMALGFDYRKIARNVIEEVPSLDHVIVIGEAGAFVPFDAIRGNPIVRPEPRSSAPALIMLSGGSTALPKLIVRTHDDYLYSFRESARICELGPESVYLCVLPAGHNFALSSPGILGVLYAGARVVMTTDPSASAAFALIEKERVTFTALVPSLASAWLHTEPRADLSSLEFVQVGGAKLSAETAQRLENGLGCRLQQVYGMTEGLVCYTRLDDAPERVRNTQGLPISADDELQIVDESDHLVADGTPGQLLVRGPYTIRGYYDAPEQNARSFTEHGYYRTGDIVTRRADGYLIVEGRIKDQVNRAGEKISAEEVESHLLCCPGVREAAVVAIPDEVLGESSCAVIVVEPERAPTVREIKAFIRERGVAGFKVPDLVRFVREIPKTTFGKIDKKQLRRQITAGQA